MNNPYTSRGPLRDPALFEGRAAELNEVASFLRGNQSVSIVGPRKIGKSSLMLHLMRPETLTALQLGDDNLLAYLDCESLSASNPAELFAGLSTEAAAALRIRDLEPEAALKSAATRPSRMAFEAAVRCLNDRGLRVVFLLDEFELLTANPHLDVSLYNALRSAASRLRLVLVTASARPLIELTYSDRSQAMLSSPFFNIFSPLFLGLLSEDEARRLIRLPMQSAGIDLGPGLEDFIYELVGGHPLALQVACFHAWTDPRDRDQVESRSKQELDAHFQYYWRHLSAAEREVLRNPVEATGRGAADPILKGILRDLTRKCLLVQKSGSYVYPGRAWADFVSGLPEDRQTATSLHPSSAPESQASLPQTSARPSASGDPTYVQPGLHPAGKSIRDLIDASLPEMLGGLAAAFILAIAGLVYTQMPAVIQTVRNIRTNAGAIGLALAVVIIIGLILGLWQASKRQRHP